ncbi:M23 family metallopeptidase [bacterium]|nr:M23 family metallopeptidase [bacterium]
MKRFNIIIVPHNSSDLRQVRLSSRVIWLGATFLCLLIACSLFFSYDLITHLTTRIKLTNTEEENRILRKKLQVFQTKTDSLSKQLAGLLENEKRMRTIAGLPEIDDEIRAFGIGGTQTYQKEYTSFSSVNRAVNTEYSLDSLLHQARMEKQILAEVCSTFEERDRILKLTPTISPMDGYLTSKFGPRRDPFTGTQKMHTGIDISAPVGTPIRATADGRVIFTGWKSGFGRVIKVNHIYYTTVYAHLHKILVNKGEKVKRHQIIASCGKSGSTTGPHVHYEVLVSGKHVDPLNYIYPQYIYD